MTRRQPLQLSRTLSSTASYSRQQIYRTHSQSAGRGQPLSPEAYRAYVLKALRKPSPESRLWMLGCVVFGVAFYCWNLERVPVSGRLRFNMISTTLEKSLGMWEFQGALEDVQGKILPAGHPWVIHVKHVMSRVLAAHQHEPDMQDFDWEVFVIDAPTEYNAYVLPGGKVFVYTGMLRLCRDEEGLATVLCHEIAHVRARHFAERASQNALTLMGLVISAAFLTILAPGYLAWDLLETRLPRSRVQEEEADRIGLRGYLARSRAPAWTRLIIG
ncbi:hypothetical protein KEM52_001877 [Ascosphaera acerosa]|nr:hypothetical protein KEM52_001877 [Ascosphaera acerosa]